MLTKQQSGDRESAPSRRRISPPCFQRLGRQIRTSAAAAVRRNPFPHRFVCGSRQTSGEKPRRRLRQPDTDAGSHHHQLQSPWSTRARPTRLLGAKPHHSLAQLAKTHGPLMSLHLGSLHTVAVTSPQMAEAAHAHDHHKISMGFLDAGSEWRALRRICKEEMLSTHSLDSSQGMRQQLRDYVQRCCDRGRVVEIHEASFVTMLNLMSATLFSIQATEFAVEEFREIIEGVTIVFGDSNFADYFPILKRFDLQGVKRKAEIYMGKLLVLVEKRQEERRKSPDYVKKNDLLEKLVDLLMEESGFKLTNNHISHLILDLLVGGSETTTTAVEWIMSELLINPEKLEKTKEESGGGEEASPRIRHGEATIFRSSYKRSASSSSSQSGASVIPAQSRE